MDEAHCEQEDQNNILELLQLIREAAKDLQEKPISISTAKPLADLATRAESCLSSTPDLLNLSHSLSNLKALVDKLEKCHHSYSFLCLLRHKITSYQISLAASAIDGEIQSYVDRRTVRNLARTLRESADDDARAGDLILFRDRVAQGFDRDFQDLILRAKIFSMLETLVCDSSRSKRLREEAALAIDSLVKFNKNVFVGLVLMGPAIRALVSVSSTCSVQVLSSLINIIRTPLVDEMESNGEIPRIVGLLDSEDIAVRVAALDCILGIAYIGRKEVIEALMERNLVEKLMELQRWECGDDSFHANENSEALGSVENSPFSDCVARFSVQLEVGEGLEGSESRAFKLEILKRVREAAVSEAEAATVLAQVLWGSSP